MAAKWSVRRILWLLGVSSGLFNRRDTHCFALLYAHNFLTLDLVWSKSWKNWMRLALGVILTSIFHGSTLFSMVGSMELLQFKNPDSQPRQQGEVEWRFGFFFIEDNFQNDPSVTGDKRSNFSASKKKHSFQKTQQKEYKTPVKKLFGLLYPRVNRWTHD